MCKRNILITILLIFSISGCGDEILLLHPEILEFAESEGVVQTKLPPEVWQTLKAARERRLSSLYWIKDAISAADFEAKLAERLTEIAKVKAMQETFYNRYIDADGIAIIANNTVEDKHLIGARHVVLAITSKRR